MQGIQFYIAKLIDNYLRPNAIHNCAMDKTAKLCRGITMNNSSLGRFSYVGQNTRINDTSIGSFTSIAGNVFIGGSEHPVEWVSTSPVFHTKKNILGKSFSSNQFDTMSRTSIGNDVWIASNVLIKAGVTIGDGAVIGMGSVVTKDVPPYEIWAGNPARCIRKRFSDVAIEQLRSSKWWEWSEEKLTSFGDSFSDLEYFLKNLEK